MPTRILKGIFFVSLLYAFFSYSLTDPNLILTSWPPYWQFQQWMWQQFFHNRPLLTATYSLLIAAFFGLYFWGLKTLRDLPKSTNLNSKRLFLTGLLAISPLFFSYNALSHDVFNYIFNAKMVVLFKANPHVQVALDYAYDDWTRFMHNTHTPAPYGYGWTALSVIPYVLGFHKFFPTWLLFRGFAVLGLVALHWVLQKISLAINKRPLTPMALWLVFLNPLLFLEVVANQHNDLWMMVPAMFSLPLLFNKPAKWASLKIAFSSLLLGFSAAVKLATVAIVPIWVLIIVRWLVPKLKSWLNWQRLSLWSSLVMFLPLFTLRSQQFLPWYLIWSLVWLPFIKPAWWKTWLLAFSLTGMARYIPWLWAGEFTPQVLSQQKWVVWGGGVGLWLVWQAWTRLKMRYNNR